MAQELRFKPGQHVTCIDVRSASSVGYLGTHHQVYDYVKHPEFLKHGEGGDILYPCISENGHFAWFYENELR